MPTKSNLTTNTAGKIKVGQTDLRNIPTISSDIAAIMEAGQELQRWHQERCEIQVYAIAAMIRERSPRRPVGGDGVIPVDYGTPSRDRPRLEKARVNSDEYGVPGG